MLRSPVSGRVTAAVVSAASLLALVAAAPAAPKAAHDLSIRMKVAGADTLGPQPSLVIKNRGTADAVGVTVSIRADTESGDVLWSETVAIPAGKSLKTKAHVFPADGTTLIVAVAVEGELTDGTPGDNVARAAYYASAKVSHGLVGRALVAMNCAECHGEAGSGGDAPAIAGASATALRNRLAAGGGGHDFPFLGAADQKDIAKYLKAPDAVVDPPAPPPAPVGGWPGFIDDARPVLQDYCGACHFGNGYKAGVRLDNYDAASRSIKRSMGSIRSGSMPQGGKRVKAEDRELLENWILGGKRP